MATCCSSPVLNSVSGPEGRDIPPNCILKTFKKLEGYKLITIKDAKEWFESDKDIYPETLFGEGVIRIVTDFIQYEDKIDGDPVEIDTFKIPHMEDLKTLALCYVEQHLTASPIKLMMLKIWKDYMLQNVRHLVFNRRATDFFMTD